MEKLEWDKNRKKVASHSPTVILLVYSNKFGLSTGVSEHFLSECGTFFLNVGS